MSSASINHRYRRLASDRGRSVGVHRYVTGGFSTVSRCSPGLRRRFDAMSDL